MLPGSDHITVFKGIRYARAPTGEMRWKPPVQVTDWAGGNAFLDIRDKPYAAESPLPGTYNLHEEVISRRRAAGTQYWYNNIGLASPVVPALH